MILGVACQILLLSFVFIHISACILILIAFHESDFNNTFLRRLPTPDFMKSRENREVLNVDSYTIYNSALYWCYGNLSRGGAPDIQIVSIYERIFAILALNFGGLMYVYIFGNIISLVEDIAPKIRSILEKNEKKVLKSIRSLNMDFYVDKAEVK